MKILHGKSQIEIVLIGLSLVFLISKQIFARDFEIQVGQKTQHVRFVHKSNIENVGLGTPSKKGSGHTFKSGMFLK